MRLARRIARAELRPRTLALAVLAYAAGSALIGLAMYPTGPYPVLTATVSTLEYLSGGLLALAAVVCARQAELGLDREIFLAGISPRARAMATASVGAGAVAITWALGSAVAVAVVVGRGRGLALTTGSAGAARALALGVALVVGYAVLGCGLGLRLRSRGGAVALIGAITAVPLLLAIVGTFPPALWLKALCPTPLAHGLLEPYGDGRDALVIRWGVPVAYLLLGAWLVARPTSSGDAREPAAPPASRGTVFARAWLPVLALVVSAAVLGYVAPRREARVIPWWLHGQWLADLARGRASAPVAEAYVAAVRRRDAAAERRLAADDRRDVVGPFLRRTLGRDGAIVGSRYDYNDALPPGTVIVVVREPRGSLELTVCARRSPAGWRVTRVSDGGTC